MSRQADRAACRNDCNNEIFMPNLRAKCFGPKWFMKFKGLSAIMLCRMDNCPVAGRRRLQLCDFFKSGPLSVNGSIMRTFCYVFIGMLRACEVT